MWSVVAPAMLLLRVTPFAAAQVLSLGVEAGVPLNPLLSSAGPDYQVESHHYTVGPHVEVRLPRRFSFEAGLLYKRLEYRYSGTNSVAISRWELPLLFGYKFTDRRWQPFVHLGGSLNRVVHVEGINLAELRHRATQGIAAGAGAERRVGALRLAPEVRVTHWRDHNLGVHDAPLRSNLTQVEVLVSVSYRRGTCHHFHSASNTRAAAPGMLSCLLATTDRIQ